MTLTTDQLRAIDRHLRKDNWLLNEDLIAELADHYANGVEERIASGIPFELAILDIHKGFGGRKGLLKMEEDYYTNQSRGYFRNFKSILGSYFRFPRLYLTVFVTIAIYLLNATYPLFLKSIYLGGVFLVILALSYILAFRQLAYWNKSGVGRMGLQGLNSALFIGYYSQLFLPEKLVQGFHPVFTTLICMVFFL
ncbi:hypothetical protein [Larkinella terrae]|uniref:Uncharacterized protein n=1 Tax=Larkinella terrae TaxID=2025311 RepID=A0A7K0EEX3_9BACT|nr:hypothetical protein [Larkinella terrae]MRS60006.1 hypothetical protein [Larkinella terrae]